MCLPEAERAVALQRGSADGGSRSNLQYVSVAIRHLHLCYNRRVVREGESRGDNRRREPQGFHKSVTSSANY